MAYHKDAPSFLIKYLKKNSISGNRKKYLKQLKRFGKILYLSNGKIKEVKI